MEKFVSYRFGYPNSLQRQILPAPLYNAVKGHCIDSQQLLGELSAIENLLAKQIFPLHPTKSSKFILT